MSHIRRVFAFPLVLALSCSTQGCYKVDSVNPVPIGVVIVTAGAGLTTSESDTPATATPKFTVVLGVAPSADVTILLSSSNTGEGAPIPASASLVFTPADWNVAKDVTVTGVDDINPVVDGDIAYQVLLAPAVSADFNYNGIGGTSVSLTNLDNDAAGLVANPTAVATNESGAAATITFTLTSIPAATVTVTITGLDATEGSLSGTTVVFDPAVDTPAVILTTGKSLTVTGLDDALFDGAIPYTLTGTPSSPDPFYNPPTAPAVAISVTNGDNDTAGFTVTPTAGLITSEAGVDQTFTVVINTQPAGANVVMLDIATSTPGEGLISTGGGVQSLSITITFTNADWNVPQTVTVHGVNDSPPVDDGDQAYTVALTANAGTTEPGYVALDPPDVSVTNQDDDAAAVNVGALSITTSESGSPAAFTLTLTTIPANPVTITLTGLDATEGSLSSTTVLFDPGVDTANDILVVGKTFTVTGVDDAIIDGNITYTLTGTPTSPDPNYNSLPTFAVSVTNLDDDTPGITVSPTSLTTNESGGSDSFTVRLTSIPSDVVTITLTGLDATEGSLSSGTVVFDPVADSAATILVTGKTVTVTGVDDILTDGPIPYTLTGTPASLDLNYNSLAPFTVSVTNNDNDSSPPGSSPSPGVTVVNPSAPTAWDDKRALEPSVINIGGTYTMWYEGSNAAGQKHEGVGLATAAAAAGPWTKDAGNPVLTHTGINATFDKNGVGDPCVVYEPAKTPPYRMWFGGRENAATKTKIGFATWTGVPADPWVKNAAPVLTGTAGTFDATGVSSPHVIFDSVAGVYKMWYQGVDASGIGRLGYATWTGVPTDPWVKPNLNPGIPTRPNLVLDVGVPGALDDEGALMPCVILDGATYRMWYIGRDNLGPTGRRRMFFAQSVDGTTWTKHQDVLGNAIPILQPSGTPGAWDEVNLWSPWAIKEGATFRIWYGGEDGGGLVRIGYTTSP